ncbi:putative signal transducing protein [Pedobacter sp. PWIIR3]
MEKIIVFSTFYNPIEANIVKTRLIDEGIHCFLSDENMITVNPLYNQALGGVKLHIFEKDTELVRSILQDYDVALNVEELDYGIEICPKCGSNNVGYVQSADNKPGILAALSVLFGMLFPFRATKVYHCFNCENEF